MKLPYRISLITVGAAIVLSVLLSLAFGGGLEIFFVVLGIITSLLAAVILIVALVLHIINNREYSRAFFITSGILLLIGIGICGPMLAGVG